jgi:hypothetical protein
LHKKVVEKRRENTRDEEAMDAQIMSSRRRVWRHGEYFPRI